MPPADGRASGEANRRVANEPAGTYNRCRKPGVCRLANCPGSPALIATPSFDRSLKESQTMAKAKATKKKETAPKKAAKKKATAKADDEVEGDDKTAKAKKKKKKKAKRKTRASAEEARLRVFWGVFNHAMKRVALYEFNQRKAAEKRAKELSPEGKPPHFVQKVKEEIVIKPADGEEVPVKKVKKKPVSRSSKKS